MILPDNQRPPPPPLETWKREFKTELEKLDHSYWVIKQPINPSEYTRVLTDIQLNCEQIFAKLNNLPYHEDFAGIVNYIEEKNHLTRASLEKKISGMSPQEADKVVRHLQDLDQRVMNVALALAIARDEHASSLSGRVEAAVISGVESMAILGKAVGILAQGTIEMTDALMTQGVNYAASRYMPDVAKGLAPDQVMRNFPDLHSFAEQIVAQVTKKKVSSLPVIGDSKRVHRAAASGAKKVTGFDEKIFEPLQRTLLQLTAEGNFHEILGRGLIAASICLELIQEAEKLPGDSQARKQFLVRRLLQGSTLETYTKSMKKRRKEYIGRLLGGAQNNVLSKAVKELLVRLSEFSGMTDLILVTTAETLSQKPILTKRLPDPMLGQTLVELQHKVERDYPLASELLTVTGGWQKMTALHHYADLASLYIQNQMLEVAVSIRARPIQEPANKASATQNPPASRLQAQRAGFQTAIHHFIDSAHGLATDNKTWDQYWLQLFSILPKQQLLKRVDWNAQIAEPLRAQWHQWIAGTTE